LNTKLFVLLVALASLVLPACGKSDKDLTPPPPSENVDSPPPGGLEENPGQPKP